MLRHGKEDTQQTQLESSQCMGSKGHSKGKKGKPWKQRRKRGSGKSYLQDQQVDAESGYSPIPRTQLSVHLKDGAGETAAFRKVRKRRKRKGEREAAERPDIQQRRQEKFEFYQTKEAVERAIGRATAVAQKRHLNWLKEQLEFGEPTPAEVREALADAEKEDWTRDQSDHLRRSLARKTKSSQPSFSASESRSASPAEADSRSACPAEADERGRGIRLESVSKSPSRSSGEWESHETFVEEPEEPPPLPAPAEPPPPAQTEQESSSDRVPTDVPSTDSEDPPEEREFLREKKLALQEHLLKKYRKEKKKTSISTAARKPVEAETAPGPSSGPASSSTSKPPEDPLEEFYQSRASQRERSVRRKEKIPGQEPVSKTACPLAEFFDSDWNKPPHTEEDIQLFETVDRFRRRLPYVLATTEDKCALLQKEAREHSHRQGRRPGKVEWCPYRYTANAAGKFKQIFG